MFSHRTSWKFLTAWQLSLTKSDKIVCRYSFRFSECISLIGFPVHLIETEKIKIKKF